MLQYTHGKLCSIHAQYSGGKPTPVLYQPINGLDAEFGLKNQVLRLES